MKILIKYYFPDDTGGGDGKTIKIKDSRKVDASTGSAITDKNNFGGNYDPAIIKDMVTVAKKNNIDPYTFLAMGMQESTLGNREFNGKTYDKVPQGKFPSDYTNYLNTMVGARTNVLNSDAMPQDFTDQDYYNKNLKGLDESGIRQHILQKQADFFKQRLAESERLGFNKNEAQKLQSWNGYPNQNFIQNAPFGKRVIDLRENVIKQNPDIVKMVNDQTQPQSETQKNWNTGLQSANMLDNKNVNYANSPAITGGGEDPKDAPKAPANYSPLSIKQRQDWNNFLDFLDKQGVGGKPILDKRDQSIGLGFLNQYKKANPDFSIAPEDIPKIQYEQYLLRKGTSFPTLKPEELNYIRNGLNPAYMNRNVSPVDSWLGSLTSKEYYPQAIRLEATGNRNYGVSMEDYVKGLNDPTVAKNYPLVPK